MGKHSESLYDLKIEEITNRIKLSETEDKKRIDELLLAGKEEEAAKIINYRFGNSKLFSATTNKEVLSEYYKRFKNPNILFKLIVDVYVFDGYNFPMELILQAKQLAKTIPQRTRLKGMPEGDLITVYRGCSITNPYDCELLKPCVSWTTNKTVAMWFAKGYKVPFVAVWAATIERDKIIAYSNDRQENEIIQYMDIKNPEMIDLMRGST